jgi:biopolymer transport protein ExbB
MGGWVMYLIFICSIVAGGITIERLIYYILNRQRKKSVWTVVTGMISEGKIVEALTHLNSGRSYLDRISAEYLVNCREKNEILVEGLEVAATYEIRKLEKNLPALSLIANLATLLGLLGTVAGMILVFEKISSAGQQPEIALLAGGVWQALLTTAFGLIVALPVMALHHYFQKYVDYSISEIEVRISKLNIIFGREPASGDGLSGKFENIEENEENEENLSIRTAGVSGGGLY